MVLKLLSFLVQPIATTPNTLLTNKGNFYLFLLNFGLTSHYLQLILMLSSGARFLQKISFFSQKITPVSRHRWLFASRISRKTTPRKSNLRFMGSKVGRVASFWQLSTYLTQQKFYLIGLPYNKKRFAFHENLTQNRLNAGLRVGTVRRYTFSKLRKARIKLFLGALKPQRLLVPDQTSLQLTHPRLRIRRTTNLRSVNPYLFLIRRTNRRTTSQTYANYLLLGRFKSSYHKPITRKSAALFTPRATFYFWKRYFDSSQRVRSPQLIFRRFRKRWYRWKCLVTGTRTGRRSLRRSNFDLSTWTTFKHEAYGRRRYLNHTNTLAQPFRFSSHKVVLGGKQVTKLGTSKITNLQSVFLAKRSLLGLKLGIRIPQSVLNPNAKAGKPFVRSSNLTKPITTNALLMLKRSKRRSFKRGIQLQFKAKRNYISLARKWGYSSTGLWTSRKLKTVKLVTWKYRVFWAKTSWVKGSLLTLRPTSSIDTSWTKRTSFATHFGYWSDTRPLLFKVSLNPQFSLTSARGNGLVSQLTTVKKLLWTKFSKQYLAPIMSTTFTRHTFFFLYLFRSSQVGPSLTTRVDFFKTNYTFVNTSTLKRSLLRRVVRTTLHLKRLFDPKGSSPQNKASNFNADLFSTAQKFKTQSKLVLPSYTNARTSRIPRIRFKPGYARQWRFFRSDVKHFLNIKTRYQYRLTTVIQRLFYSNRKMSDWDMQTKITPFLVQSRLVPDFWSATELLKASSVFVNGHVCTNTFLNIFFSDFIQLVINIKYYVVNKWLMSWSLRNSTRVLQLNRKFAQKRRSDGSSYKPKPLPNWIFRIRYSNYDIPRYIEVDFFTLSAFVVQYTNSLKNVTSVVSQDTQFKVFNMYNWKYIT
jgi:hypothetical protein